MGHYVFPITFFQNSINNIGTKYLVPSIPYFNSWKTTEHEPTSLGYDIQLLTIKRKNYLDVLIVMYEAWINTIYTWKTDFFNININFMCKIILNWQSLMFFLSSFYDCLDFYLLSFSDLKLRKDSSFPCELVLSSTILIKIYFSNHNSFSSCVKFI